MAYPASILSLAHAIGSQFLSVFFGGSVSHATGHNQVIDDLAATETKVGISESSAQDSPLANTALVSLTNGKSKWAQITNAMLAGSIAYSKLNLTGAVLNADLAGSIAVSKLAAMSNKTLLTSNGTTNAESAAPTVSGLFTAEGGLSGGTTGTVKAGAGVYPSNQSTIFLSAPIVAASTPATGSALIGSDSRAGLLFAYNASNGLGAIFLIRGGFDTTTGGLLAGDATNFGVSVANDSKIHLQYNSHNYYLYNGYGTTQALYAWFIGI
jgi:hypothetical protein